MVLDQLFQRAVAAIDAGDLPTLEQLLVEHPELVRERLEAPGVWLRDGVGNALDGFFHRPYLLWFVAEDPVRRGKLPSNIADIARAIIAAARKESVASLPEQLDYALSLTAWSWIARQCNVQIALIDVLVDAGAKLDGNPENALINANLEAAEHLLQRGAPLTLATALCFGRWGDVPRLAAAASVEEKQFALTLNALRGRDHAIAKLIEIGVDLNTPSKTLYSHAPALHHAVHSGSLATVRVLVDAGASLEAEDTVYHGTPLGWAEHMENEEIAAYLREKGGR